MKKFFTFQSWPAFLKCCLLVYGLVLVQTASYAQCGVATIASAAAPTTTSCGASGSVSGPAGGQWTATALNGVYYQYTYNAGLNTQVNGMCINGTVQPSGYITNSVSSIGFSRSGAWNANSAVLTYTVVTPTLGSASNAGPIDFCNTTGGTITTGGTYGTAISANSTSNGTVNWYFGSSNGTWSAVWGTGTASPSACCFPRKTATSDGNADRVRYTVVNGSCVSGPISSVLIRNRYNDAPSSLSSSSSSYCQTAAPGSLTLTANFATAVDIIGTVKFYSGSCGGTLLGSVTAPDNSTTVSLTGVTAPTTPGTYTYYALYDPGTTSGSCSTTACASTTVTVYATTVAATLAVATPASGNTICAGYGVSATINAGSGGGSGSADTYEYSINNGSSWSTYTSGAAINTTGATGNVLIRVSRSAGTGGCAAVGPNTIVTWPVAATLVQPTLGTATPASGNVICQGYAVSATINAGSGGSTGAADAYRYSTDGGATWTTYTSGASIATGSATGSVIVQSQRTAGSYGCSSPGFVTIASWTVASSLVQPTLNTATPASGSTICQGYAVNATINAGSGGSTGATDAYRYSTDGGATWTTYTSGASIATGSATGSVIVQSQRTAGSYGCSSPGFVTIATWTIGSTLTQPTLNTATPASGSTICQGYAVNATINAGSGGSTGAADAYRYSTDGGATWTTYTSGASIATGSATGSVIVQSQRTAGSYGCSSPGFVTIATWTIGSTLTQPTLNTATPASGTTVCQGYAVNATINAGSGGSTGAADAYRYSTDGGATWTTYTSGASIATGSATGSVIVQSQRTAGSYGCSSPGFVTIATWPIASPLVQPTLNTATPASGSVICQGYAVNATITAGSGGSTGAADAYRYSTDGGATWGTYTSGASIATGSATGSVIVQGQRTAGSYGCSSPGYVTLASWTIAGALVQPTLNTATPASGSTICQGYAVNATITAGSGGGTGAADAYRYSTDGGATWTTYTSGASIATGSATGSVIVQSQRTAGSYGCSSPGFVTIATWTIGSTLVQPTLNTATPASGSTICQGYNVSATINAGSGGSSGAADAYRYSTDGGATWTTYTSGSSIATGSATGSVIVQGQRTAGSYGCSSPGFVTLASWTISAPLVQPTLNTATPASGSTICQGYAVSATITAGSGGSTGAADAYRYSIDGGATYNTYTSGASIATGSATGSVIVQSQRTAGSYGCSSPGFVTIATWTIGSTLVQPTLNTATPASGTTICQGFSVSATINAGSGGSTGAADAYRYSIDGGATYNTYTSGSSIATGSATGSVIIQSQRTAGSYGCSSPGFVTIVTWPVAAPLVQPSLNTATPASGTAICQGYAVSATITAGSGGSTGAGDLYRYSIDGGATWSTYTSGTSINTPTATGSVIVQVQRTAGSYGCTSPGYVTIATWPIGSAVVAPTLNTATPSSGTTICQGYAVSATITAGSGGSGGAADAYRYSTDGGATWTAYTSGASIATGSATGSVVVQVMRSAGSYGCSGTTFTTVASWPVGSSPVAPTLNTASPANGSTVCTASGSVSATVTAGSGGSNGAADSYRYSKDGGATWTTYTPGNSISASGATTSIIIQGMRSGGSYGCTATAWTTLASWPVVATPTPTFTTVPSNPICTYTNATYTTQSGYSSYVWSGFGAAGVDYNIISGGLGSTDYTVTLQWITTGTKSVTISYSSGSCPAATPGTNTTVVNASPTPTLNTSGAFCTTNSVVYSTQSGQSAYTWTFSGTAGVDYTLIAGGGSSNSTATIQWITPGNKTVTVNYTNGSGCTGPAAASTTNRVTSGPTAAGLSDVIDGCNGGHTATVTITGGTSPFNFTVCGTAYTNQLSPFALDAKSNTSCSLSFVSDSNGCVPGTISGSPVNYPARVLTSGDTYACTVSTSATKIFYDHSGNLMVKITDGGGTLGSTSVAVTKDATVQQYGPVHPQSYLQRHFKISPTNTSGTASVCLYMSDAEVAALKTASASDNHGFPSYYSTFSDTLGNAVVTKFHGAGETPLSNTSRQVLTPVSKTHNPVVNGVTYNNVWEVCLSVSTWSGFYIHSQNVNNTALPVTMLYLTADAIDNKYVDLDWATASEINNSGFAIERSTNGIDFDRIGWVEGHGNSNTQLSYSYSDRTVQPGVVYYYRLKQVDVDGQYVYTEIVSASLIGEKGFSFEDMIPNPATNDVQLGILTTASQKATITISDVLGRTVLTQPWQLSEGYNISSFDITDLSAGTYSVTVYAGNSFTTKKLVVTK